MGEKERFTKRTGTRGRTGKENDVVGMNRENRGITRMRGSKRRKVGGKKEQ